MRQGKTFFCPEISRLSVEAYVRQIRALHLLVKTGSVSATARLLHVSQPAISKMIRSLEAEMGVPLLDHVRGKIQPRHELDALLPSIDRITQELSDLRILTDEITRRLEIVRIAKSPGIAFREVSPSLYDSPFADPPI